MDGTAVVINVGGLVADDGCELAMHGFAVVLWVANSTAKLNGFEWVGIVEALKASDNIGILAHDPEMVR